ncbi:MAG TPA: hypothetical protein VE152_03960 [Acidimicrobiales bacterium]|nr:hypothetical protein [Acidimicrobiales bacterium]
MAAYVKGKMPNPPPSADYYSDVGTNWGMLGNDQVGDCTIDGAAHAVMAWNSEVGSALAVPDAGTVVKQYEDITGGKDTGCVESNVLTLWRQKGLWGSDQIAAFAPVNTQDLVAVHQAIAFYGCAYIGVTLPRSAMDQFNANQPWSVVPGSPIEGGHCVVLVGYDPHAAYAVTWGRVVPVTYPFLATYMDECWAIISEQFVQAKATPALDLATLQADLGLLKVETNGQTPGVS